MLEGRDPTSGAVRVKGKRGSNHEQIFKHSMRGFILISFAGPPGGRSLPFQDSL